MISLVVLDGLDFHDLKGFKLVTLGFLQFLFICWISCDTAKPFLKINISQRRYLTDNLADQSPSIWSDSLRLDIFNFLTELQGWNFIKIIFYSFHNILFHFSKKIFLRWYFNFFKQFPLKNLNFVLIAWITITHISSQHNVERPTCNWRSCQSLHKCERVLCFLRSLKVSGIRCQHSRF